MEGTSGESVKVTPSFFDLLQQQQLKNVLESIQVNPAQTGECSSPSSNTTEESDQAMHPSFANHIVLFTEQLLSIEAGARRTMMEKTGKRNLEKKMDGLENWLEALVLNLSHLAPSSQLKEIFFFGSEDLFVHRNVILEAFWKIKEERSKWNDLKVEFNESKLVYDLVRQGFGDWNTALNPKFKLCYLFVSLYCGILTDMTYRKQRGVKRFLFDIFLDKHGTAFRNIHSAVSYVTIRFIRFQQWTVELRGLGLSRNPIHQGTYSSDRFKVNELLASLLSADEVMWGRKRAVASPNPLLKVPLDMTYQMQVEPLLLHEKTPNEQLLTAVLASTSTLSKERDGAPAAKKTKFHIENILPFPSSSQ